MISTAPTSVIVENVESVDSMDLTRISGMRESQL